MCAPGELKRFIRCYYVELLPSIRRGSSERIAESFLKMLEHYDGHECYIDLLDRLFLAFPERCAQLCEVASQYLGPSDLARFNERAVRMRRPLTAMLDGLSSEAKRSKRRAVWLGVAVAATAMSTLIVIHQVFQTSMDFCDERLDEVHAASETRSTDLQGSLSGAQKDRDDLSRMLNTCIETSRSKNADSGQECAGWQEALSRSDELVQRLHQEIAANQAITETTAEIRRRRRFDEPSVRPDAQEQQRKSAKDAALYQEAKAELHGLSTRYDMIVAVKEGLEASLKAVQLENEGLRSQRVELERQLARAQEGKEQEPMIDGINRAEEDAASAQLDPEAGVDAKIELKR